MSSEDSAPKEAHVRDLVIRAQQTLYLTHYAIRIVLSEEPDKEDADCEAECQTNHPYLNAKITVYPEFWKGTLERQWHAILHECAHIITQPMKAVCHRLSGDKVVAWQEVLNTNETLTDWIARIAGGRV